MRPPPIFAALDRRASLRGNARVSRIIVRERRLLDPGQALIIETVRSYDSVGGRERLVVIDHQCDAVADDAPHRAHDFDVLANAGIADFRFDALESAFHPFGCDAG